MLEEVNKAIGLAMEEFVKEYGKMEDGDEFVTEFNNCSLVISLENGKFMTRFIGGKPFRIDFTLSIYEED